MKYAISQLNIGLISKSFKKTKYKWPSFADDYNNVKEFRYTADELTHILESRFYHPDFYEKPLLPHVLSSLLSQTCHFLNRTAPDFQIMREANLTEKQFEKILSDIENSLHVACIERKKQDDDSDEEAIFTNVIRYCAACVYKRLHKLAENDKVRLLFLTMQENKGLKNVLNTIFCDIA